MSFGMGRMKTGTIACDGNAHNEELGFVPKLVLVWNETDVGVGIWINTMTDADMGFINGDGPAVTYETSNGISAYAGTDTAGSEEGAGFTLGANANLNGSGDTVHYFAMG